MAGEEFFVGRDGNREGPFTGEQLCEMASSGQLKPDHMLWKEGMQSWTPARNAKGFFDQRTVPPPLPPSIPPPLPSPSCAPRPEHPAGDDKGVELAEEIADDEVELAEEVLVADVDPQPSRTGATQPRRARATHGGSAGIPRAKVAGGVVAEIVVLVILGALMKGSSGPSGENAPQAAVDPSPPVDPRALPGTWTYSGTGPDGLLYEGEMVLNRDGSFAFAMSRTTADGQRVGNSAVGGTWSVKGKDLVLARPDPSVGAPIVKSIVAVDAGSLTVQNVDTGVVSRWLRGSGEARGAPPARQPSLHDGGTGSGGGSGMAQERGPSGSGRRAPASAVCPACKGTGFDTLLSERCTVCRGTGIMRVCDACNGTGKKPSVGRPLSY